jgi:hypothetical protein
MRRYSSGLLLAVVMIPPHGDYAELVAHELEHVLEQMEGVNLAALARSGSGAVKRRPDGAYETARALNAGLAVAAELRNVPVLNQFGAHRSLRVCSLSRSRMTQAPIN